MADSITRAELNAIAPNAQASTLNTVYPNLVITLEKYSINTKLRIAHFLAQVIHESGSFRYREEIASGQAYEGRKDLGNTVPGDGKLFKGRGYIQLTGRANYKRYSDATGINFVIDPKLVADPKWAMDVAGWYWNVTKLNPYADLDDIDKITKLINGGYNGLQDRKNILTLAKAVLKIV